MPGTFPDLAALADGNEDVCFLANVAHLQLHRRTRALGRLSRVPAPSDSGDRFLPLLQPLSLVRALAAVSRGLQHLQSRRWPVAAPALGILPHPHRTQSLQDALSTSHRTACCPCFQHPASIAP